MIQEVFQFSDAQREIVASGDIFGLTGGMGSGKSSVSRLLQKKGAFIVDADQVVHDLQQPAQPMLQEIAVLAGNHILAEDGSLRRSELAQLLFSDDDFKRRLLQRMNTYIRDEMFKRIKSAPRNGTTILDVPLLIESGWVHLPLKGVIVVDCPIEVAVERLVTARGFERSDAQKRIATQASRSERLQYADYVIRNDGSVEDLEAQVEQVWNNMQARVGINDV